MNNSEANQVALNNQINDYFSPEKKKYAILISREWGCGKTYFLKNKVIPYVKRNFKNQNYRFLYISLSGVKDLERLKELMFSKINVSLETPKTTMDKELEVLKNVVSVDNLKIDLSPIVLIPQNIVFCFDDLERISPDFNEEALGFINQYIEQRGNKVIFISNEHRSDNGFNNNFSIIKEKYIHHTIELKPSFDDIFKENDKLSDSDRKLLICKFEKGQCGNLRTFRFVLDSINYFVTKLEFVEDKYQSVIIRQIVNYISIFSIELKKGIPYEMLLKIFFPHRILSFEELGFEIDLNTPSNTQKQEKTEKEKKEEETLKEIQNKYFDGETESFEPFKSIAKFLVSGHLAATEFQQEITTIIDSLKRKEGTDEEKFLEKANNIFKLSDSNYLREIEDILKEIDKGVYSLGAYLETYSSLLVLESYEIYGVDVNEDIKNRFIKAMNESFEKKRASYVHNFQFKYGNFWNSGENSKQESKYRLLLENAVELNDKLVQEKNTSKLDSVFELILSGRYDELHKLLVGKRWDITFDKEDALCIFNKLQEEDADKVNTFRGILKERYTLKDSQTVASYEYSFIKEMIHLIDSTYFSSKKRTIKAIPFLLMKKNLIEFVRFFSLDKK